MLPIKEITACLDEGTTMHVRELVELGALAAAHGSKFVHHSQMLTQRHMEQYWLASRCRHDRWFQAMKSYERATPFGKRDQWPTMRAIMQEVLASELLSRTWAAVGCCYDQFHDSSHFDPIVRSVLVGHMEARNRVLHALVRGKGIPVEEGVKLNRLRRQTERWTDMMLGYLACNFDVDEFAFDPEVAKDFADDLRNENGSLVSSPAWELTLASLRATYQRGLIDPSPHAELNDRIAASVLACFHADLFNSIGMFKSHWMLRMGQVTDDTQGLVEDLLHIEEAAEGRFFIRR
jgi:hypothetical protein